MPSPSRLYNVSVQLYKSISLGLLQGTNTRYSKLRARARKLMNVSGTLPFFIFVSLEFSTFLKLLYILPAVISTPSFSTDPILCFLSLWNFLIYYLLKKHLTCLFRVLCLQESYWNRHKYPAHLHSADLP